jgi:CSLREA domain-containing protein/uncharacterized repeat protein (TIGR01451 family)
MAIKRSFVTFALGLALAVVLLWVLGGAPFHHVYAANLLVTTFDDELNGGGDCSLREAVQAANTNTAVGGCLAGDGIDTILLGSGTYVLTIAGSGEDGNASGDLDVTYALTIAGLGPAQTIVDGGGLDRVLDVRPGVATIVISGVTILNGSVSDNGGGIYNSDARLTLINTVVLSNTAVGGGGVYVMTGTVELIDSQVLSNTALSAGGGVYLAESSAMLTQTGTSAIAANGAQDGGGIYVQASSVLLDGGQIAHNTASFDGGGVYVDVGQLTLTSGQIAHNVATDDGGGVYVGLGQATLEGGQVLSNTALDVGGGVHVENGLAAVSGTQVVSNFAPFGGGVFVDQGQVTVSGGEVSSNTAVYGGGGLCIYGGSAAIDGGLIVSNTAWAGGGLFVYDAPVTVSGGEIRSNSAITCGGGVFLALPTSAFTQTGVSTISLNVADSGGGVCALDGTTVLSGGLVLSNTAYTSGGGVFVYSSTARLQISGTQVLSNTAGDDGGGVYVYWGSATIDGGHIAHNQADHFGGGLCVRQGTATLVGGQVQDNEAYVGGGLFLALDSVTMSGTRILSNTAGLRGGGVFMASGAAVLDRAQVEHNRAPHDWGGGICVQAGTAELSACQVSSNSAHDGGGISVFGGSVTVSAGQVTSNTALHDGGGFLIIDGALALVNCTVSGNRANNGGALYVSLGPYITATTVVLTHTTVASNTASSRGGGIDGGWISPPLLHNTLLAHNVPANCDGTVASNGHNLSDDGSCTLSPSDISGVWARIGPLTEDGGALVHPLLPDSPAIDAGRCVAGITTDQRGQPRPNPVSPFCDIGAYEANDAGSADLLIAKVVTPTEIAPGAPITYVLTFTNAGAGGATGVFVTDVVPVSVTVHGVISSGVAITEAGPGYAWQVQNLLRGQGGVITITGALTMGVPASMLTNTASITTTTTDDLPGNNHSQAQVTVLNVAPAAGNLVETTTEAVELYGTLPAFDANGDELLFGVLVDPITGSVIVSDSGTGAFVYTPFEGWAGTDQFTFVVTDSGGLTDTGTVVVHVIGQQSPTISDIPDQTTLVGTPTGPIAFTVSDPDTPADALSLWAGSSDTALVPVSAIALGGSGADRTVAITPTVGLTGTATITIHVFDGERSDSDSFILTVEPYCIYVPVALRNHP